MSVSCVCATIAIIIHPSLSTVHELRTCAFHFLSLSLYLSAGNFMDVRMAALKAIADIVQGKAIHNLFP